MLTQRREGAEMFVRESATTCSVAAQPPRASLDLRFLF